MFPLWTWIFGLNFNFLNPQEQYVENIAEGVGAEEEEKHNDEATEEFFQCAVCRQNFLRQVDFFVHLKSHYEPAEQKKTSGAGEYKLRARSVSEIMDMREKSIFLNCI